MVAPIPTVNISHFNELRNATRYPDLLSFMEISLTPYTDVLGNLFWLFCWTMIFVAYWIRQKKMTFPTIIALVFGFVFISMLPEEYQPYVRAIIAVGVLGIIYLSFTEKR